MRGLERLIDYAGLFPPAGLKLEPALAAYRDASRGPGAAALGRFVAPLDRVGEIAVLWDGPAALALSVVARADAGTSADAVRRAPVGRVLVEAVEARVQTTGDVRDWAAAFGDDLAEVELFLEVPWQGEMAPLLDAVARAAISRLATAAKLRTGGVEAEAFPPADEVARFILGCRDRVIRFKATAGLHHALQGAYPLTYEPGAECAPMHGLLGLLVAAAFALDPAGDGQSDELERLVEVIGESDPSSIRTQGDGLTWRGREISGDLLRRARNELLLSVGSCSFDEPVGELAELGLRVER